MTAPASGPFETERQARETPAVRAVYAAFDTDPGPGKMTAPNAAMLTEACDAAAVELGTYDHRILVWLAGWEPATCAVVAGIIARAHQSAALDEDALRLVLDALYVAADHKREVAAECAECDVRPEGLCPACESRLDTAEAYDKLAGTLRGRP